LTQADGTALTSWTDLSASKLNLSSSSPRAPLVKTNIQNSLRGVLFDGVDDWMNWHPVNADKISRFVCFKWLGGTTAGHGTPRLFDGYECSLAIRPDTNCLQLYYWRGTTTGDYRTNAGTIQPGNTYLVEIYRDRNLINTPPEIWINGQQMNVNIISVESGVSTTDTFIALGNPTSNVNGTRSYYGYYFEHRFFDTILDATTRASNRSAILNKWGLSGAIRSKINAGSEAFSGSLPILVLTKDTVHGSIAFSSTVSSTRSTPSPAKTQRLQHNIALVGAASRKFPKTGLVAGINLSGSVSAQITQLTGSLFERTINLSGRLIPTIVTNREHNCRECIKRWFHRWLSRSD
jgi:hypothetical protein